MNKAIAVIGLGLIGGSAARSLKAANGFTVYGDDRDAQTLALALSNGALDAALTPALLSACDMVMIALYPRAALDWMRENAAHIRPGALVIDLCGVKREVCAGIAPIAKERGFTFIGGHPMAGVARFGFLNSDQDMFKGASMILTPEEPLEEELLSELRRVFGAMGFGFLKLTNPDEHDRMIAYTSQLAHVLSSAYAQSPAAERHIGFSAGSLKDMTRVATLNVPMWAELFIENRDYLAEEVEALSARLDSYAKALRRGDTAEVARLLDLGCRAKRRMEEKEAAINANGAHPGIQAL